MMMEGVNDVVWYNGDSPIAGSTFNIQTVGSSFYFKPTNFTLYRDMIYI